MIKLLILFGVSLCLAYCSQNGILVFSITEKRKLDLPLVLMVILLTLFCGLRTHYNDTALYIAMYESAETLEEYLTSSAELTENPLFYSLQSFFRHSISPNANVFLLFVALFSIGSTLRFIRKYSDNFIFSVLLFFALGLYVSHLAAMKQCLAIAVLTYAVEALFNKKYVRYFLLLFIAMLFHTYAIFFIVLPLFTHKPWTIMTYITVGSVIFALLSFESVITSFLSAADSVGKYVSEEMVLDKGGINPFRLMVFAVPPLLAFVFQEYLDDFYDRPRNILMNMSILSFLILSLGLFNAANLFGRSAIYFELGTIVILPGILKEIFEKNTARFISVIASICYFGFFAYSIIGFDDEYRAIGLFDFVIDVLS